MNRENYNWSEDVFQSMKGAEKAKPRPDLFAEILGNIDGSSKDNVVSLVPWRNVAAAAVVLLFLNLFAVYQINQNNGALLANQNTASEVVLISDYLIYE